MWSLAFPDIPMASERSSRVIAASRRSSSVFTSSTSQTYTNMAISRPGAMRSSLRCSLCLMVLWVAGTNSSTLRLHPAQRYMLPQNRGFFTIEASGDLAAGDGAGAAASALPVAARRAANSGSDSGAERRHRTRRSSGDSTMPKVYGQVMECTSTKLTSPTRTPRITSDCP